MLFTHLSTTLRQSLEHKKVVLISTLADGQIQDVYQELQKRLEGNIELTVEADALNSTKMLSHVSEANCTIIVEKRYVSKKVDIRKLIEMVNVMGVKVNGCVIN